MSDRGHLHRWIEDAADKSNQGDRSALIQWKEIRDAIKEIIDTWDAAERQEYIDTGILGDGVEALRAAYAKAYTGA